MSAQLTVRNVSKAYTDRPVLDDVSLTVKPGEHVGIVGENGSGKSTLLRLIAGVDAPDDGTVTVTAPGGIGHLGQTLDLPDTHTVRQAIDAALADLRAMELRLRELEADLTEDRLGEYGELLSTFEARGGYEADARTDKAVQVLGLGSIPYDRPLGALSGGERARLGLACLLAASPEVMLLDEPTNHLDPAAVVWLEDRLREHRGTVVAISHDRLFLDRVATATVEVEHATVTRYGGNYTAYLAARAAMRRRWEQAHADWCRDVGEAEHALATTAQRVAPGRAMTDNNKMAYDRNGGRVQSSVASRIRRAKERLRRLHENAVPAPPEPLRFTGGFGTGATSGVLVHFEGVRVGHRLVVPDFHIEAGQRLLVHGANGAGKSTLLRVLAGALEPDDGTVHRRGRIGYLPQDPNFVNPARSVLSTYASGLPGYPDEIRDRLRASGLLDPELFVRPVGTLSVGQRQRLALARMLSRPADLLLLDEPTNHLSPTLVEELEQALDVYPGALVVVSHDRALHGRFTGTRVLMSEGALV
ncbi:ribosomal protection-like ABC-F family protein [Streptomyces sp. SID3343]|uniref:ribosomal protection-like ABC-F family protein n=1 Tax=Streptomyces sp. SID3343 TaxID=2690260 RepID=UPI001371AB2F|nr:ABC-F family ATP-binding cassette domain-containing protein [Streptomyces sp. SID3343]MYW01313.1 ATP-binding cassette domain-containing protein [Streptomyces sp. SID3343]